VPEISRFYGLIIYMYPKDHLPPHLHAKYGEDWVELHENELLENWNESFSENPNFKKIEPLN